MIQDEVQQLLREFKEEWSPKLAPYPQLQLDLSWPSVGTLDHLTYPLRLNSSLKKRDRTLVRGASAYLAAIAHDCWSGFPGNPKVTVTTDQKREFDVEIRIEGGEFLNDSESFSVNVTQALRKLLNFNSDALCFFGKKLRIIPRTHNLVSLFGIGLMSGLTPFGKGPWVGRDESEFVPCLKAAQRFLAESSAAYYRGVYPEEPLGGDANLYLEGLILPPAHHSEHFPACRAVVGLINLLKRRGISAEEIERVALNLATSPDELISSAGFALSCALVGDKPSPLLNGIAQGKGSYAVQLRAAVITARDALRKPHDLMRSIELGDFSQVSALASIEQRLRLIPLFRISFDHFHNPAREKLVAALVWFDPKVARTEIDNIAEAELSPDIMLQAAYLDTVTTQLARATKVLNKFESKYSEGSSPYYYSYFELRGMIAILQNRLREGGDYYAQSFRSEIPDREERERIGGDYVRALVLGERYDEALKVSEQVLRDHPNAVSTMIYRVLALRELERRDQFELEKSFLEPYVVIDRRVFALLTSEVKPARLGSNEIF